MEVVCQRLNVELTFYPGYQGLGRLDQHPIFLYPVDQAIFTLYTSSPYNTDTIYRQIYPHGSLDREQVNKSLKKKSVHTFSSDALECQDAGQCILISLFIRHFSATQCLHQEMQDKRRRNISCCEDISLKGLYRYPKYPTLFAQ